MNLSKTTKPISTLEKVKKEEDTSPINDTKRYFSFWSSLSDSEITSSDYSAIPPAEDGTLTCRYCQSEMKQRTAFEKHETVCKKKFDSKKGSIIRYCENPCHCEVCKENDYKRPGNCKFEHISGQVGKTWLTSLIDEKEIILEVEDKIEDNKFEADLQLVISCIRKLLSTLCFSGNYPDDLPGEDIIRKLPSYTTLKKTDLVAISNIFYLEVYQAEGNGNPLKRDYAVHVAAHGNWSKIIGDIADLRK